MRLQAIAVKVIEADNASDTTRCPFRTLVLDRRFEVTRSVPGHLPAVERALPRRGPLGADDVPHRNLRGADDVTHRNLLDKQTAPRQTVWHLGGEDGPHHRYRRRLSHKHAVCVTTRHRNLRAMKMITCLPSASMVILSKLPAPRLLLRTR